MIARAILSFQIQKRNPPSIHTCTSCIALHRWIFCGFTIQPVVAQLMQKTIRKRSGISLSNSLVLIYFINVHSCIRFAFVFLFFIFCFASVRGRVCDFCWCPRAATEVLTHGSIFQLWKKFNKSKNFMNLWYIKKLHRKDAKTSKFSSMFKASFLRWSPNLK